MNLSAVSRYFGRAVSLLLLLGAALFGNAQNIRIKLVNGRNGRPMANSFVNTWIGIERKDAIPIATDKDGVAWLSLTHKDAEVNTQSGAERSRSSPSCGEIRRHD